MKNPAARLLRRNISPGQTIGYALANFTGLTIIIASLMFYLDVRSALSPGGNRTTIADTSYMVLSPSVGVFGNKAAAFNSAGLDSLRSQPWVVDLAPFRSAEFSVSAYAGLGSGSIGTALFFESVPDRFLDNPPSSFRFIPGDSRIPVIIPRDYLSLYNFGFAAARNLPPLSEAMISSVPLTVTVAGDRGRATFPASIVGFTDRVNSILVPDEFLRWANAEYGDSIAASEPERVIVKTTSPGNPEIRRYLESHSLSGSVPGENSGKMSRFLEILTGALLGVGAVITLLAFALQLLSIGLLLQKNRREIAGLLLLGYSGFRVGTQYLRLIAVLNISSICAAVAASLCVSRLWETPLAELGVVAESPLLPIIAAFALSLLLTLVSLLILRRGILRYF